jgi:hypothetical protein
MTSMKRWSADVRDRATAHEPKQPAAAARHAAFRRAIVEAAASRRGEGRWCSAVRCIGRVGRKACSARIHVARPEAERVEWSCVTCGQHGEVTGFVGTELDMSAYVPSKKKLRVWDFDDEEREVLLTATTHIPSLRAIVARASPAAEGEGLLIVQVTINELDEVYTLIEQLTDATCSRRRIERLDGMRASLCSAMDGF